METWGKKKLKEKLYNPGNVLQKSNWGDFHWLMIERVTQQVWNWRWASNLCDTSNTKVTFPNSWKYHISSSSFAAFSSPETVFLYFLKWVYLSPNTLIKLLFHDRKNSVSRKVRTTICHIPTQVTWNSSICDMKFKKLIYPGFSFCMFSSSGKGLNLQLRALSIVCCHRARKDHENSAKVNRSIVER